MPVNISDKEILVSKMEFFKKHFLYLAVFVNGAAVLVIEILGTRIISPFYGATVAVWTSLILITLGALALGYFLGGRAADKWPSEDILYYIIFTAGIFFFAPMKIYQWVLPSIDRFGAHFAPLFSAFLLFFIPLLLLGMIAPFAIRLTTPRVEMSGSSAGTVFALGTAGSVLGGFLSGFYFIDKISISDGLTYMAAILLGVAAVGLLKGMRKQNSITAVTLTLLFVGARLAPSYEYKDALPVRVIRHEQSKYADLKIIQTDTLRCLVADGIAQSCSFTKSGKSIFAYTAEIKRIVENEIKKYSAKKVFTEGEFSVLLLGLGAGDLAMELPDEASIDIVEVDPQVYGLARGGFGFSPSQHRRVVIDDARHFLRTSVKRYDIIISDLYLGNNIPAHAYSKEAFQLTKDRLKRDGLMLVNLNARPSTRDSLLTSLVKTAKTSYPSVSMLAEEPEDGEKLQNIILEFSPQFSYTPDIAGKYKLIGIDYNAWQVATDNYNPLSVFASKNAQLFRDKMFAFGGARLFFSL